MHKTITLSNIKQYIEAAYAWHESGEASDLNDEYSSRMAELERTILTSFGLPLGALYYSEILQAEGFEIDRLKQRVNTLYKRLLCESRKWLLSPVVLDEPRLREAKAAYTHIQHVLPLMGFSCTRYSSFLYYNRFLAGLCNEHELLRCLRIQNDLETVYRVSIPYDVKAMNNETIQHLDELELPYLQDYLQFLLETDDKQDWDIETSGLKPGLPDGHASTTEIDEFILHTIFVIEPLTCFMEGLHWTGTEYRFLFVTCTQSQILELLQYAQYPSQAGDLHYMVQQFRTDDDELDYNLLQEVQHNLLINRCMLRLGRAFSNKPKSADEKANYKLLGLIPIDGSATSDRAMEMIDDDDDIPF